MSEDNTRLWSAVIPANVTQSRRILGFRMRNIIEGVIAALITAYLIHFIPFVPKVQIIVTIGIAGSILVLNLLGLKGMSLSECMINYVKSKASNNIYHMRSIKYVKKNNGLDISAGKTANFNESLAEKGFRLAKEFIKEEKEKRR